MATINEIKNLIKTKIEGQGSQVDIGNGLPQILNGIMDAIGEVSGLVLSTHTPYSELSNIDSLQALKSAFGDVVVDEMLNAAMTGTPLNIHHLELIEDIPGGRETTLYYPVYQYCSPEAGGTGYYELTLRFGGYCLGSPIGIADDFIIEIDLYKGPDSEWQIEVKVGTGF